MDTIDSLVRNYKPSIFLSLMCQFRSIMFQHSLVVTKTSPWSILKSPPLIPELPV